MSKGLLIGSRKTHRVRCCASALSLQSSEPASSVKDCALVASSTVEREPSDSTGCNVGGGLDGGLSDDDPN
eukprot:1552462-Prymnesium_polylepis.2